MTDREPAIWVRGLSKDFGPRTVLDSIDLKIPAGQNVGLIGANGAGKTTLLRCLAALIRPTRGEVRWFGQPVTGNPATRRLIGVLGHENRLYSQLTLKENLVFAARMCGVQGPKERAVWWLRRTTLSAFAEYRPSQISQGMRQRVAVARALIHDPRILLLDEPFSGLDEDGIQWLMELLQNVRRDGCALCFASHDLPRTEQLADRVFCLQSGHLHEISSTRVPARGLGERLGRAA